MKVLTFFPSFKRKTDRLSSSMEAVIAGGCKSVSLFVLLCGVRRSSHHSMLCCHYLLLHSIHSPHKGILWPFFLSFFSLQHSQSRQVNISGCGLCTSLASFSLLYINRDKLTQHVNKQPRLIVTFSHTTCFLSFFLIFINCSQ